MDAFLAAASARHDGGLGQHMQKQQQQQLYPPLNFSGAIDPNMYGEGVGSYQGGVGGLGGLNPNPNPNSNPGTGGAYDGLMNGGGGGGYDGMGVRPISDPTTAATQSIFSSSFLTGNGSGSNNNMQ